ncbi:type II toxin-antitoxin system HicA family toxin [Lichenicoccus sp.]|uniref:type II toxin-antitoxin system HicA family toxin n=1 Tax=Lichenicoccus sp. TaxID=2781899 RepID=UPI003D0FCC36
MNSRQVRTLKAVFSTPVLSGLEWAAIESLLIAAGCEVIEGSGSRVRFVCKGIVASFHRPHPAKEAKQYQVRDAREFLTKIGVRP